MDWTLVVEQTVEISYLVKGIPFMTEIYEHKHLSFKLLHNFSTFGKCRLRKSNYNLQLLNEIQNTFMVTFLECDNVNFSCNS